MSYCIACKNLGCENHGKNLIVQNVCSKEIRLNNIYRLKNARTQEEFLDIISEAVTAASEYNDFQFGVKKWLEK